MVSRALRCAQRVVGRLLAAGVVSEACERLATRTLEFEILAWMTGATLQFR